MLLDSISTVIAVVGSQRTGTTLAGQMFGAPPTSFLIDENDGLYPWFGAMTSGQPVDDLESDLVLAADRKHIRPRARSAAIGGLRPEVDLLVLKAPNLTMRAHDLAQLPARTLVLYPVRDPRATVTSMLGHFRDLEMLQRQVLLMSPEAMTRFASTVELIRSDAPAHLRFAGLWLVKSQMQYSFVEVGLNPVTFRYEDLVAEPEATCRSLCAVIDVPYAEQMTRHSSELVGRAPGRTRRDRSVDRDSIDKWHDVLSPEQSAEVWSLTRDVAERLGYREAGGWASRTPTLEPHG